MKRENAKVQSGKARNSKWIEQLKKEIEKSLNIKFIYKPILLGGLHKLSNITAAAFIESKKKWKSYLSFWKSFS